MQVFQHKHQRIASHQGLEKLLNRQQVLCLQHLWVGDLGSDQSFIFQFEQKRMPPSRGRLPSSGRLTGCGSSSAEQCVFLTRYSRWSHPSNSSVDPSTARKQYLDSRKHSAPKPIAQLVTWHHCSSGHQSRFPLNDLLPILMNTTCQEPSSPTIELSLPGLPEQLQQSNRVVAPIHPTIGAFSIRKPTHIRGPPWCTAP